ncbi:ATPase/DNA helicase [Scheffersomyces coipomensis]|uniref:ATPase/DNA helicase n=1 Tax=Scheffersomyces coipomensis TaxID=1788519 RepID=UPI00315DE62D
MVVKRRFFGRNKKSENILPQLVKTSPPPSPSIENSLFVPDNDYESDEDNVNEKESELIVVDRPDIKSPPTVSNKSIRQELFETQLTSIIGHVSLKHLHYLYKKYDIPNNQSHSLKLAINEYLNGISSNDMDEFYAKEDIKSESTTNKSSVKRSFNQLSFPSQSKPQPEIKPEPIISTPTTTIQEPTWKRFIGSLDVQAWATRPTLRPLNYQQSLQLRRLVPKNSSILNSSIIRIFHNDREIGRIPEDLTRILSPLIDFNFISFEVIVLESTLRRLSIGDSFLIHINIYVNNIAFDYKDDDVDVKKSLDSISPIPKKAKFNNFNFSTESKNESILRLRQFAISKLFDKLGIRPLKTSPSSIVNAESIDTEFEDSNDLPDSQTINLDSDDDGEVVEIEDDENETTGVDEVNLDQLKQFYQQNNESNLLNSLPDTTTPPPDNFKLDLRPYQKIGLSWMILREGEPSVLKKLSNDAYNDDDIGNSQDNDGIMNPLWRKYKWPENIEDKSGNDSSEQHIPYFYANLYNGELSLEKPIIKTTKTGGILADEMGLGKTISTLALINSIPYDLSNEFTSSITLSQDSSFNVNKPYASKTTLIIVPMSLLTQWKNEFDKANNNPNHYCQIYYGNNNNNLIHTLIHHSPNKIPVVILTTYGTIQNEYIKLKNTKSSQNVYDSKTGIYAVNYFRIILDEGHNIRNRNTKTAKSIYELYSKKKWILTGTPIINKLDDLYSLIKFLKLEPWSNFSYWKTFITLPFEQKQFSQALDIIKSILDPILLRRTKDMKQADGKPLIELPEKEIVIEQIKFNQTELKLYNWLKSRANKTFKEGLKTGQILRQYTQILTHILRLRQVCCHMDLVGGPSEMDEEEQQQKDQEKSSLFVDDDDESDTKTFLSGVKQSQELQQKADYFANDTEVRETMYKLYSKVDLIDSECSICTTSPISLGELVVTPCGHSFCVTCLMEHIEFQTTNPVNTNGHDSLCPNCRFSISKYKLFRLRNNKTVTSKDIKFHTRAQTEQDGNDPSKDYTFQLYLYNPDKVSSKIQALFNHLKFLKEQSPQEKVIVFSQFSSYLDIIESELKLQLGEFEFRILKFDGRLSMQDREKVLIKFNEPSLNKFTVLLLSLKSGGVGLNLTQASRAYMMDPWWSPSIEDQAIDRIHRIGQNNTVKVVRFIMENSIEIKMLKIQERKKQIGEAVGVEEEERRKRRIEEIKILFEE